MASVAGIDANKAIKRLTRYLGIEGVTGQEKKIGQAVVNDLLKLGVARRSIRFDQANEQIPLPTQTGNLIVTLPGSRKGDQLLFSTHLDTVPLCAGAKPVRKGDRIVSAAPTALGGDNRTGVACLVTLVETLLRDKLSYPPLTLLFTVREESGLWGARFVKPSDLKRPTMGFNVDGRLASHLTVGAVGAERWQAEIHGLAAHAGAHPEQGVSATLVASLALAEVHRKGYFGKVCIKDKEGSSNVGSFGGQNGSSAGEATNVVTDLVVLRGESRSQDTGFVKEITGVYRDALKAAAQSVTSAEGKTARIRFESRLEYFPFSLKPNLPVVRHAEEAARSIGLEPELRHTKGGLDANWIVRNGIPSVTFGAGQHNIHTVDEYVEIEEFLDGCRLAVALATLP